MSDEKIVLRGRMAHASFDAVEYAKKFFGVEDVPVVDTTDAEREAALKAASMDSLADEIQEGIDYLRDAPTMVRRLTKQEWELIVFALRAAAE